MYKLQSCEPQIVFKHFEDICRIPHGSGNEKALSDYILAYAKEKGLWAVQDEMYNLIVKIPASKGYEGAPAVIIQGHLDMVCEKNKGVNHDFEKEGIDAYVDGDWVKANGTTLGADNGIAVAYGMAMMEMAGDANFEHPALEIVLTVLEEVGLEGAAFLSAEELEGTMLINADTSEEGFLLTGCAGGSKPEVHIPVERIAVPQGYVAYSLEVKGLLGGHSGMEIHKLRANANRVLARLLHEVIGDGVYLAHIAGGLKDNAITREAEAVLFVSANLVEICIDNINSLSTILSKEYRKTDSGLKIIFAPFKNFDGAGGVFSQESAKKVVSALMLLPYGPLEMSADFEGIVETSNNIGVVTTEENKVTIICAVRSSVGSRKEFVKKQIETVAALVGATVSHRGDYPAWEYEPNSKLRDVFADVYKQMYGKEVAQGVVHAGVECGLFAEKIDGLDMVSFGPEIHNLHTPDEKMSISSTKRSWEYLLAVLKALK